MLKDYFSFGQSYLDAGWGGVIAWGMMVDEDVKRYITRENKIPVGEIFGSAIGEDGHWQLPQQFEKY